MKNIIRKSGINARVVVTPGKSIKTSIKPQKSKSCTSNNCILCTNKMPCQTSHYVYELTCKLCTDNSTNNKPVSYVGASRRIMVKRLGQHEASFRRFNDRTSIGEHMIKHHKDLKPKNIPKKGRVNFNNLFQHFTPKIIHKGKDTLDLYLKEGIHIKKNRPSVNTMHTNGFV